jgi:hypothetical protein
MVDIFGTYSSDTIHIGTLNSQCFQPLSGHLLYIYWSHVHIVARSLDVA